MNTLFIEYGISDDILEGITEIIREHNKSLFDADDEISEEIERGDFTCISGPSENSPCVISTFYAINAFLRENQ